jgi:hypothetical protein
MATRELNRTPPSRSVESELSGLDNLDMLLPPKPSRFATAWSWLWPKVAAVAVARGIWPRVVWWGW